MDYEEGTKFTYWILLLMPCGHSCGIISETTPGLHSAFYWTYNFFCMKGRRHKLLK